MNDSIAMNDQAPAVLLNAIERRHVRGGATLEIPARRRGLRDKTVHCAPDWTPGGGPNPPESGDMPGRDKDHD